MCARDGLRSVHPPLSAAFFLPLLLVSLDAVVELMRLVAVVEISLLGSVVERAF